MFKNIGFLQGEKHGREDAQNGKPQRPHLDLHFSLLSNTYQTAYLVAYYDTYRNVKRVQDQVQTRQGIQQRETDEALTRAGFSELPSEKDKAFDLGWEHGFTGTPTEALSFEETSQLSYKRGYHLGARSRDDVRATSLQQRHTNDPELSQETNETSRSI